jgi:hypothetical protein
VRACPALPSPLAGLLRPGPAGGEEASDLSASICCSYTVLHKRYTDLGVKDVPICCNLVVADTLLDEQPLSAGLLPALAHALQHLATHDATVLPASMTLHVQAAQMALPRACGLDLGALDSRRWAAAAAVGTWLGSSRQHPCPFVPVPTPSRWLCRSCRLLQAPAGLWSRQQASKPLTTAVPIAA